MLPDTEKRKTYIYPADILRAAEAAIENKNAEIELRLVAYNLVYETPEAEQATIMRNTAALVNCVPKLGAMSALHLVYQLGNKFGARLDIVTESC